MAADDVAKAVGRIAVGTPVNGIVEVAGPEQFRLDELIREGLSARKDPREVVADPQSRYFGARLGERTLVPADGARLGEIRFQEWLIGPPSTKSGQFDGQRLRATACSGVSASLVDRRGPCALAFRRPSCAASSVSLASIEALFSSRIHSTELATTRHSSQSRTLRPVVENACWRNGV